MVSLRRAKPPKKKKWQTNQEFQREWLSPGQLWDVYGAGRCKQGGKCWCYGEYKLRNVVSELKRA